MIRNLVRYCKGELHEEGRMLTRSGVVRLM
jgi:hypothetical protein